MTDLKALVPKDHLPRKAEKVMDYDWLYEQLSLYYCEDNGRPVGQRDGGKDGIDHGAGRKAFLPQHAERLPELTLREVCGINAKDARVLTTHIWQEYLDPAERSMEIYALSKETIELVFADNKDKCGMRYTTAEVWPWFPFGCGISLVGQVFFPALPFCLYFYAFPFFL